MTLFPLHLHLLLVSCFVLVMLPQADVIIKIIFTYFLLCDLLWDQAILLFVVHLFSWPLTPKETFSA